MIPILAVANLTLNLAAGGVAARSRWTPLGIIMLPSQSAAAQVHVERARERPHMPGDPALEARERAREVVELVERRVVRVAPRVVAPGPFPARPVEIPERAAFRGQVGVEPVEPVPHQGLAVD